MSELDVNQYREELLNRVGARAEADGLPIHDAFVAELAEALVNLDVVQGLDPVHFRGVGERRSNLGVDGYYINGEDDSIDILIASYDGSLGVKAIPSLTQGGVDRLFSLARNFLRDALSGAFAPGREPSDPAVQLAIDIEQSSARLRRITVHAVSDLDYKKETIRSAETLSGVPIEFRLWDISKLFEIASSLGGRDELTIVVGDYLPCDGLPSLSVKGAEFDTFLLTVPAKMLARLYEQHGNRLLESNVRSYLSARGKVNKGIRTTLESAPGRFLAYNNGITATATGVILRDGMVCEITDLQVVNGGQTTASLYYIQRDPRSSASLEDVAVQMKLVVVDPRLASELVPNISRFANSQNAVNEADFFSNSPFHVRLEQISKRLTTPSVSGVHVQSKWYYERARGQYQNDRAKLTRAQQKRFDLEYPKKQVITKTDAARYANSWGEKPHLVSRGAQKNFMAFAETAAALWDSKPDEVNEMYYRDLVSKAIIYRDIRAAVMKAPWYQQGYLANIVTLTIARVAHEAAELVGTGERFSLEEIWKNQALPASLLGLSLQVAEGMLAVLVSERRTRQNVTEWAKDEASWKMALGYSLPLGSDKILRRHIVPAERVLSARKRAAAAQRTDDGIGMQTEVVSISADRWRLVRSHLRDLGRISAKEDGVLAKLANGRNRFVPEEWQAAIALECHRRAADSGLSR